MADIGTVIIKAGISCFETILQVFDFVNQIFLFFAAKFC